MPDIQHALVGASPIRFDSLLLLIFGRPPAHAKCALVQEHFPCRMSRCCVSLCSKCDCSLDELEIATIPTRS